MVYHFAWVDATDDVWSETFARDDEDVFSYDLEQNEGEFATLEVVIKNPRVGLLASTRKRWCWFSHDDGTTKRPLFFGRVIGLPADLIQEVITLNFVAKPVDFQARKIAAAALLKVAPYYDPAYLADTELDDPDNVLDGYPALWHIDAVTHEVTASDCCVGEDGLVTIDESEGIYDSVAVSFSQPPARRVDVTVSCAWDQTGAGSVDISNLFSGGVIYTLSGGLLDSWPEAGASIGGGWSVADSSISMKYGFSGHYELDDQGRPAPTLDNYYTYYPFFAGGSYPNMVGKDYIADVVFAWNWWHQMNGGLTVETPVDTWSLYAGLTNAIFHQYLEVPVYRFKVRMSVGYSVTRKRTETLAFSLSADVQDVSTEETDDDYVTLNLNLPSLNAAVDDEGAYPLRDLRQSTYFSTARGTVSIENALLRARAVLLTRARCANVAIDIPFMKAITDGITLRKNASLTDGRLPGGSAEGKIISRKLSLDGDSGDETASLTFACMIGRGGTVEIIGGTPVYVDVGYVDSGYQQYAGATVAPPSDDVTYTSIEGDAPLVDDGVNLFSMGLDNVTYFAMGPSLEEQQDNVITTVGSGWHRTFSAVPGQGYTDPDAGTLLKAADELSPFTITLRMRDLTGSFDSAIGLTVDPLKVPKSIDLEAA